MSSARQTEIREALTAAGRKRARAEVLRKEAAEELQAAVPWAVDAGIPVTEIAERSSMTRQAVYNLLAKQQR